MLLDIINKGIGLKLSTKCQIIFAPIMEDRVKNLKNRGHIKPIDVFDSNFVSFMMAFYIKNKRSVSIPINFKGYLKEVLFDKINTGVNLNTHKFTTVKKYMPVFYRMYSKVPKKDIKRMVEIGIYRICRTMEMGGSLTTISKKTQMHIGVLPYNFYNR